VDWVFSVVAFMLQGCLRAAVWGIGIAPDLGPDLRLGVGQGYP